MKIKLNDTFKHEFSFTQEDIVKFAEVTGDNNPIHLDPKYAAETMFKVPIMHGMLGASLFSKVFGTLFPGKGTIYLKQSLSFLKPMYVNTSYEAVFTVKELNEEKHRAVVETVIMEKASQAVCTTGEATIMNTDRI
ncbi:MAG: MaoC family dehydratase [Bacteroidia bacterium]|nr:MaoC family dehydratase [Bacteroidia bacterium]MCZ2248765.1 MaoC family dehydratase [Bacteroidia bacterium]